jgi:hypothetical protein
MINQDRHLNLITKMHISRFQNKPYLPFLGEYMEELDPNWENNKESDRPDLNKLPEESITKLTNSSTEPATKNDITITIDEIDTKRCLKCNINYEDIENRKLEDTRVFINGINVTKHCRVTLMNKVIFSDGAQVYDGKEGTIQEIMLSLKNSKEGEPKKSLTLSYNMNAVLFEALENNDLSLAMEMAAEIASIDIENKVGETPLISSVKKGNIATVSFFLAVNADPLYKNAENKNALDYAKEGGNKEIVKLIEENIQNKSKVNTALEDANSKNVEKKAALTV